MNNDLTIIIPNYNGQAVLHQCLGSMTVQKDVPQDIIVIDNNSTDKSVEIIQEDYPAVRLISMRANSGIGSVLRMGIKSAKHKNIVIMNNHVVVPHGWLDSVFAQLEQLPAFGKNQHKFLFYSGIGHGPVARHAASNSGGESDPQIRQLEADLLDRTTELGEATRRIMKLEAAVASHQKRKRDVNDLTYRKSIAEGKVINLEQQLAQLNDTLRKRDESLSILKESIRKRTTEKAGLNNKLSEKTNELAGANKRIKNLSSVVSEFQAGKNKSVTELEIKLDASENMIATLKRHISEVEEYYEPQLREKDAELQKTLDSVGELISNFNKSKAGAGGASEKAYVDISGQGPETGREQPSQETIHEYEKKLHEKDVAIENAMALVSELVENISELKIRIKSMKVSQ